jgi:FHA domain
MAVGRVRGTATSHPPGMPGPTQVGTLVISAPAAMRGMHLRLPGPIAILGRRGTAVLDTGMVSPEHARVWVADGQVWIVDLGSVGGTAVNGVPIAGPCPLQGGDHLRFADVEAVFYLAPGPDVERRRPQDSAATEGAFDPAKSATARYLCAATHLDHQYRARVLDATVREAHRAVCPSYGVDLAVVARHAVLAHRRALLRDAGLTGPGRRLMPPTSPGTILATFSNDWSRLVHAWTRLRCTSRSFVPGNTPILCGARPVRHRSAQCELPRSRP